MQRTERKPKYFFSIILKLCIWISTDSKQILSKSCAFCNL